MCPRHIGVHLSPGRFTTSHTLSIHKLTFKMRTSRRAVLRTRSSSSLSLNFLIATICPEALWRALPTIPYALQVP